MEMSLFDIYLRLCTVTASIRLSLSMEANKKRHKSVAAGAAGVRWRSRREFMQCSVSGKTCRQGLRLLRSRTPAAPAATGVGVGFDKPGLLLHSACPLIKPSLQSAVGSCSWLDGLILFAPDLPVALF
ncbi:MULTISPECIES: hypothetical protein [unclassified Pseudomonas]|uniref:hypothetical protein n=1 Tax=unclassified Pseudomonas TaxID=196821 RepID=UPI0011AF1508|nr:MULTISPECIES: hypothetical protein [unclassified Pseudomonas]